LILGAIQNFTGGLVQMLADRGIRANAVAPSPIWMPLIPRRCQEGGVVWKEGSVKWPGKPTELATAYVGLADPHASYTSGTTVAVTGG
jgi:NAD(P)-dependent dehydrogenase (short-subunit alcohol dehydrogenase family)